jgi:circadian clock protein KaiC
LINNFQPQAVIIDPISNLTYSGNENHVKSFLMRVIDFLKQKQITSLLTSLTVGGSLIEHTDQGVSSLMDTWLIVRDIETNGERDRLLQLVKSRGMEHSNQVREFRLTSQGVQLVDVYLGSSGVLTGTARAVQEAKEKAEVLARQEEIARKQRELARKRLLMEAQIQALQLQFAAEQEEIEQAVQQEKMYQQSLLESRQKMARSRKSDH